MTALNIQAQHQVNQIFKDFLSHYTMNSRDSHKCDNAAEKKKSFHIYKDLLEEILNMLKIEEEKLETWDSCVEKLDCELRRITINDEDDRDAILRTYDFIENLPKATSRELKTKFNSMIKLWKKKEKDYFKTANRGAYLSTSDMERIRCIYKTIEYMSGTKEYHIERHNKKVDQHHSDFQTILNKAREAYENYLKFYEDEFGNNHVNRYHNIDINKVFPLRENKWEAPQKEDTRGKENRDNRCEPG